MQRLNKLREDRGAVAVWVALLLIPLMIVAALAIDISAANTDRQRLQIGADAAALAIAQDCALAGAACEDRNDTADHFAKANPPFGGPASGGVTSFDPRGWVEVTTSSERDHWFAPVIQQFDIALAATSAASWGDSPISGSHIPLAISWCEIAAYANLGSDDLIYEDGQLVGLDIPAVTPNVTLYSKGKTDDFSECPTGTNPNGPNGDAPPGGFGWLLADAACRATTSISTDDPVTWSASSPGRNPSCTNAELLKLIGTTIMLPIFDETLDSGSNATYRIFGYIAFEFQAGVPQLVSTRCPGFRAVARKLTVGRVGVVLLQGRLGPAYRPQLAGV